MTRVYGPYLSKRGKLKGRRSVIIVRDDGSRFGMLYSRYLMEQKLGRRLRPDEHVDHIDEDKANDSISNLQILSPVEHAIKSKVGRASPGKGVEKGWRHGTWYGWSNKRCTCDACAAAKRAYHDRRNATRRVGESRGPYRKEREHGTRTMYRVGCRCDLCRAHNAKRARNLKMKNAGVG